MISIIIPAHNELENLSNRIPYLESMIASYDGEAEVVVIVSKSTTDETMKLKPGRNIHMHQSANNGRAVQMNEGVGHAKGDILAFLHADVIPPDNFLQDMESAINSGIEAGFFSYQFDSDSWLLRVNAYFTGRDGLFTGGGDQCLFIRRQVFEELGGFDTEQVIMEDFDFFWRMKKSGVRYSIVQNDMTVSARKYETNSYIRVNLANLILISLFKAGWPAPKLKRLHDKLLRVPYTLKAHEATAPKA